MTASSAIQKSLPIIEKAAPLVATLLGGPAAGTAVSMLEKLFGVGDIDNRILNDPEAEIKLKQADVALRQAELNDLASARNREIEIAKISGNHDWFLVTLALIVIVGFGISDLIVLFISVAPENKETINHLGDTFATWGGMIIGYYYGASHKRNN